MSPLNTITEKAAARLLGMSAYTIKTIRERREIGAIKIGKRWRYMPEAIEEYLARNSVKPEL